MSQPKPKILVLVAQNENDALLFASKSLQKFFAGLGRHETLLIDLLAPDGLARFYDAIKNDTIIFGCAFAGVGAQLRTDFTEGENVWTYFKTPFLSLWFDHPAYNYRQHAVDSPYVLNCYHVEDHYRVWQACFSANNAAVLLDLYFGANPYAENTAWQNRKNELIYIKSGVDPKRLADGWRAQPPLIQDMLWFLVEAAQKNRNIDLVEETRTLFARAGLPFEAWDLSMGIAQEVDAYIRAWRSDKMARALMSFDATIHGNGWDYLKHETKRAVFAPPLPPADALRTTALYRLTANTNPLWREGIHERTARGIAAACVTVTDHTEASRKAFGDLSNYRGFEWEDSLQDSLSQAFALAAKEPDFLDASFVRIKEKFSYNQSDLFEKIKRGLAALPDFRFKAELTR